MRSSLTEANIQVLLTVPALPRKAKVLCLLALQDGQPKSLRELRELAASLGLKEARRWHFGEILARLEKDTTRTRQGWALTAQGWRALDRIPALLHELAAAAPEG